MTLLGHTKSEGWGGDGLAVAGIGGGIGAARLWCALQDAPGLRSLSLVVNVADDVDIYGLRVCPDIDTVLYALSGRQDTERGWGVRTDTFRCMEAMRGLGHEAWFNLGDLDLATHLTRAVLLEQGLGLAKVTEHLAQVMGVRPLVLPMSEQRVTTRVSTATGAYLHYEEFLVRHGAAVGIKAYHHEGLDEARPAPGVLEALEEADLVVIAPSNPVASVLPVLGLPGVREILRSKRDRVVAVTPIVNAVPLVDDGERRRAASRAALMASDGLAHNASAVSGLYRDIAATFIVDEADSDQVELVEATGMTCLRARTLLGRDPSLGEALVRMVLAVASGTRTANTAGGRQTP